MAIGVIQEQSKAKARALAGAEHQGMARYIMQISVKVRETPAGMGGNALLANMNRLDEDSEEESEEEEVAEVTEVASLSEVDAVIKEEEH